MLSYKTLNLDLIKEYSRVSFFVPSSERPSAAFMASLILDEERGCVKRNSGGASPASFLKSFIFSNISPIDFGS